MNSKASLEILESRIAPAFAGTFAIGSFLAPEFNGADANDNAGFSVADAGDVNGDGNGDFIIGAPFAAPGGATGAGAAYVVFGKDGNLPVTTDLGALNGTNGFRIDSSLTGANFGRSVAGAGDVNGDGFDDVVIGAPLANINGNNGSGIAYVVFGSASPGASIATNQVNGLNGFAVFGTAPSDLAGISVASAGDVNGDGFSDVVIGASGFDAPQNGGGALTNSGGAVVVYGHAGSFNSFGAFSAIGNTNQLAGFRISGENTGDGAGSAVSSAGDFNGDGFGDILIGASTAEPPGGGNNTGAAYIMYGAKTLPTVFSLSNATAGSGLRINGIAASDGFGDSAALVGDVNQDGFSDVIIGASGNDSKGNNSGEAYVVFGGKNLSSPMSAANADIRLQGTDTNTLAGTSVSSAGDFNGDGFDDFLIGATNANISQGEAYLVFGQAGSFTSPIDLNTLDGTNGIKIVGEFTGDDTGFSVAGGSDVNNDGFDDLLISSYSKNVGGKTDAGVSTVIYGSNGNNQVTLSADGRTATYTDADGDLITIKTNKGAFEQNDFKLSGQNLQGGSTLQKLDLTGHTDLSMANITVSAKAQLVNGVLRGDGLVNIGGIDATGISLGAVKVAGDLGRISAGTGGLLLPAVKSLTVNSLGVAGAFSQNPSEVSDLSLLTGTLGTLNVKTNIEDVRLLAGKIGTAKIGGDVTGSSFFVIGDTNPQTKGASVALKSFTVKGDFERSTIGGGVFLNGNADVALGRITIGGDCIASNITAGVSAGDDGLLATDDDQVFGTGGNANIVSRIASVVIKGQALGTIEAGGRFTIEAEQVGLVQVGKAKLSLNKAAKDKMFSLGGTGDLFVNEV